jgi:hypothetical protein
VGIVSELARLAVRIALRVSSNSINVWWGEERAKVVSIKHPQVEILCG